MNLIIIHKKSYSFPATWNELSSKNMLRVAPYLLGTQTTLPLRKAAVLFSFLPTIKKYWTRHPWITWLINHVQTRHALSQRYALSLQKKYPLLTESQKWELMRCVDYLFDQISGVTILKLFRHNNIAYYLPGDNFTRESIIAFAFADEYFNRYVESGDAKYIDLLIACIARQKGSRLYPSLQFVEGDEREHFSTARTDQRAKEFKTLPDQIKTAILLYFMGSKKYIHTHYEIMFRKAETGQALSEEETTDPKKRMRSFGKKKIPKPNFNWIGVIYELSETGVFGSFDQVKHMFVHTCCYYLAKKRYEKEEQTA